MAIAKKPTGNRTAASKKADAFISGAAKKGRKPAARVNKTPTVIRFPPDVLTDIDAAAEQRGISRSAWLLMVATRALDSGDW